MKKKTGILSKFTLQSCLFSFIRPLPYLSSIPSTTEKLPSGKDLHSMVYTAFS